MRAYEKASGATTASAFTAGVYHSGEAQDMVCKQGIISIADIGKSQDALRED